MSKMVKNKYVQILRGDKPRLIKFKSNTQNKSRSKSIPKFSYRNFKFSKIQ